MTTFSAICNTKGGTAKSTTCANLAALAASVGKKTLIVDLDPQGTCSFLSRINCEDISKTASAMFQDVPVVPSELAIRSEFGYDVVPAGPNLVLAVDWLFTATLAEQRLKMLLDRDKELLKYDIVLFDTFAGKSRLLTSCLFAVDDLIIPVEPSKLVTRELTEFIPVLDEISDLRESIGSPRLKVRKLFFNKVKERQVSNIANMEEVRAGLEPFNNKYPVAYTVIPDSAAVGRSQDYMIPVVIKYPKEKVSINYKSLYNEVFVSGGVA